MLEDMKPYKRVDDIQIFYKEIHWRDRDTVPPVRTENKVTVLYKGQPIWETYMGNERLYYLPRKVRKYYALIQELLEYLIFREISVPTDFLEKFFDFIEEKKYEFLGELSQT